MKQIESTKYLELFTTASAFWSTCAAYLTIEIIRKLSTYLPPDGLKTIYLALVLAYITYAIEVWHGAYQNTTDRILILQKRCMTNINSFLYNEHTSQHFKEIYLLNVPDLYTIYLVVFMHRLLFINAENIPIVLISLTFTITTHEIDICVTYLCTVNLNRITLLNLR